MAFQPTLGIHCEWTHCPLNAEITSGTRHKYAVVLLRKKSVATRARKATWIHIRRRYDRQATWLLASAQHEACQSKYGSTRSELANCAGMCWLKFLEWLRHLLLWSCLVRSCHHSPTVGQTQCSTSLQTRDTQIGRWYWDDSAVDDKWYHLW
jgi:hypothetical protein